MKKSTEYILQALSIYIALIYFKYLFYIVFN